MSRELLVLIRFSTRHVLSGFVIALVLLQPIIVSAFTPVPYSGQVEVQFDRKSAVLSDSSKVALARSLARMSDLKIENIILSVPDLKPKVKAENPKTNAGALALARANAVREFLTDAGLSADRIFFDFVKLDLQAQDGRRPNVSLVNTVFVNWTGYCRLHNHQVCADDHPWPPNKAVQRTGPDGPSADLRRWAS